MSKSTYIRIEAFIDVEQGNVVIVLPKRFGGLDPEEQRLLHDALSSPYAPEIYENRFGNRCIKREIK